MGFGPRIGKEDWAVGIQPVQEIQLAQVECSSACIVIGWGFFWVPFADYFGVSFACWRLVTSESLLFFVFAGAGSCLIWVVGHSFVYWGGLRAGVRPAGRQLGFSRMEAQVRWLGLEEYSGVSFYLKSIITLVWTGPLTFLWFMPGDLGVRTTRDHLRDIKWTFFACGHPIWG